jgi:hypothetical protein
MLQEIGVSIAPRDFASHRCQADPRWKRRPRSDPIDIGALLNYHGANGGKWKGRRKDTAPLPFPKTGLEN